MSRAARQVLRPHDLRDANEVAVLRELLARGPASRSQLATAVGLTQAPITRMVARLVDRGLVRESDRLGPATVPAGRGRPTVPLELEPDAAVIIGAHLGLQRITFGRTGLDGSVVHQRRVSHRGSWPTARRIITDYVTDVERSLLRPVDGIGVIIGGSVDPVGDRLLRHDALGWTEVEIGAELSHRLDRLVAVEASVRAHATADLIFGAAAAYRDFVHVFVGNLVEVAVVVDRRVRPGRDGVGGDLAGWTMPDAAGRPTTLDEALGDRALVRRAATSTGLVKAEDDLATLVVAAESPDGAAALQLMLDRASATGILLARLDALLAPEAFVLSGGVLAIDGALARATATLREQRAAVPSLPVVQESRFEANPLVSAAAAVVLERTVLSGAPTAASVGSQSRALVPATRSVLVSREDDHG